MMKCRADGILNRDRTKKICMLNGEVWQINLDSMLDDSKCNYKRSFSSLPLD